MVVVRRSDLSNRADDFAKIRRGLEAEVAGETANSLVALGDSLALLRRVPTESVSLVLCDPPYHSTKKGNIYGDKAFKDDQRFLEWLGEYAGEWQRILKPSGTLYVFCSSEMAARLEVLLSRHFRPLNHITWTKPNDPGFDGWKGKMNKEALRRWYPHSERILMFEHGTYGLATATQRSPLGQYLRDARQAAGLSAHELTERIGAYGAVNHGGAVSNWECGRNTPSREQYEDIRRVLEASATVAPMPEYEDIVRPMSVVRGAQFTDVWDFMSVRPFKGKHPAEKPQDLLMHMISASSRPGDIVLDCFAGSGSTGVAALRLGRRAVCIEIEQRWVSRAIRDMAAIQPRPEVVSPSIQRLEGGPPLQPGRLFEA